MNDMMQKRVLIFSFLALPIGLLVLFLIYPTVKLFQYSMTDWNGIREAGASHFQFFGKHLSEGDSRMKLKAYLSPTLFLDLIPAKPIRPSNPSQPQFEAFDPEFAVS
ncbi:hypothetical protein ASL11_21405 [Paenibacillus sp. Soil750]|nr:hypothetical protein ASL11_21405 [Paenibacillus sp. Soil750]